jgi:iron(III) transport system substrate-binding protein
LAVQIFIKEGKMGKRMFLLTGVILAVVAGLILPAKAAEEVTVYSSNMQALNDLAAAEFQKVTGIKVNMVRAPSGVAVKRMQAEKNNPQGDVFWGVSKVVLMANQGLL